MTFNNVVFFISLCSAAWNDGFSQRRLLDKKEGATAGVGFWRADGTNSLHSFAGYFVFSFKEGVEFQVSGGSEKSDEGTVNYFSPALEVYGSAGRLRPFVDISLIKSKHAKFALPQAASMIVGTSLDLGRHDKLVMAPEVGYGFVMDMGGSGANNKPQRVLEFDFLAGYPVIEGNLFFVLVGVSQSGDVNAVSLGCGMLFK